MTKQFRVYVRKPNGRYGVEQRRVVNFPGDLTPDGQDKYLRDLFAKFYPGETYDSIDDMGDERPNPRPGQLPAGVNVTPKTAAAPK